MGTGGLDKISPLSVPVRLSYLRYGSKMIQLLLEGLPGNNTNKKGKTWEGVSNHRHFHCVFITGRQHRFSKKFGQEEIVLFLCE